jgi:phospholipid transport system substrate-binding protein
MNHLRVFSTPTIRTLPLVRVPLLVLGMALATLPSTVTAQAATAQAATVEDAKTVVVNTVAQVLGILKEHQTPENERRSKLIAVVAPRFDFENMAKSSLGYHWRDLNATQQGQFTQLFTAFMEDAYLNKLEGFSNQHIEFLGEHSIDPDDVEVNSRVITPRQTDDPVKVDYLLQRRESEWKVYDVMVDGISITANYRNQFNRVVNNQGFDALMNEMRSKQQELVATLAK